MAPNRVGEVVVIFVAQRTAEDADGYAEAAAAMESAAALQPGYRGFVATRGPDGLGIALSYWESDDAAKAWRDHAEHARIREQGRARWYHRYTLDVARVERGYNWARDG